MDTLSPEHGGGFAVLAGMAAASIGNSGTVTGSHPQ